MSSVDAAVRAEWDAVVTAAVVGTDRRMAPPADAGFDVWARAADPASALLDRAAAAVVARRAGARPSTVAAPGERAPADGRPACPAPCAARLRRLLRGEHDELLPEWLARFATSGWQLPWEQLPQLLQRGRREPGLDQLVRAVAGERARWLAETLPELGIDAVRRQPKATAVSPMPLAEPVPPVDSGAVATAVVEACRSGAATWAAAPELRRAIVALDPSHLPALVAALSCLNYQSAVERTRSELMALAQFRHSMVLELTVPSTDSGPTATGTVTP